MIVVAVAAVRLIVELLAPVWPYLLALLVLAVVLRVVGLCRDRW